MRHWNTVKRPLKLMASATFLPYLWGIETIDGVSIIGFQDGFYPTYEALKHFVRQVIGKVPFSFYPTYEALKPLKSVPFFNISHLRFYPTYEALKPLIPTRKVGSQAPFLPYLWGIETRTKRHCHTSCDSFYPTYEALKQNLLPNLLKLSTVFTLPMRHWNTNDLKAPLTRAKVFLPYLWGIEISFRPRVAAGIDLFLPYLWGIETSLFFWQISRVVSFYPTYEALKHYMTQSYI